MATVYAIECIDTGWIYVGCTVSTLNRRLNEHRSYLKRNLHTSTRMQEDFVQYGAQSFKIRPIEKLPEAATLEVKREAELRWLHHYQGLGILYNAHIVSFSMVPEVRERGRNPEADLKRSLAQRGKPKGHGAKISATKKALGQRPSLEAASLGGSAACKVRWGNR